MDVGNGVTKKGQAAGAAVLLAIIAGFIIMFVVLMPPADRAELLGDGDKDNTTTSSGSSSSDDIEDKVVDETLLSANPGRIDYLAQREIEHPLPVINIFTKKEAEVLAEKSRVYTKKSVFSEESGSLSFSISDLAHTENIILSLNVLEGNGRLSVSLNGEEVYNSPLAAGSSVPITLLGSHVKEQNEITFKVSSPGIAFWATNDYVLENVKVVADVTKVDAQFARHVFLVSETEKRSLEKIVLNFQPGCKYDTVGKLTVKINGNEIYNAVPDCDLSLIPLEFSPDLVSQGENRIEFRTEEGNYLLSHVALESTLKDVDFPTFYFELSQEQYENVLDENKRVRLEINFVDVVTRKYGDLVFNGHLKRFDTKEASLVVDLSDDVVKGNNALKIKPSKTLEVRQLKVDLVK